MKTTLTVAAILFWMGMLTTRAIYHDSTHKLANEVLLHKTSLTKVRPYLKTPSKSSIPKGVSKAKLCQDYAPVVKFGDSNQQATYKKACN
jgi:hypothetical protein